MSVTTIPTKTPLGHEEMRRRTGGLGQRHRTILFLIDGRRPLSEVLSLALKAGAVGYLAKPVQADEVVAALLGEGDDSAEPAERPMSADRVRWEHIHRVFEQCNRNVSETARRLNMHRRTLQRILAKRAPR